MPCTTALLWLNILHHCGWTVNMYKRLMYSLIGHWDQLVVPSWKHSFLDYRYCLVHKASPEIRHRETILIEFGEITSTSSILQGFPWYVDQRIPRRLLLRLVSQLVDLKFSPITSWASSCNVFNGWKRFLTWQLQLFEWAVIWSNRP